MVPDEIDVTGVIDDPALVAVRASAWRILRVRDNEVFVRTIAAGALTPAAAQKKARALLLS